MVMPSLVVITTSLWSVSTIRAAATGPVLVVMSETLTPIPVRFGLVLAQNRAFAQAALSDNQECGLV